MPVQKSDARKSSSFSPRPTREVFRNSSSPKKYVVKVQGRSVTLYPTVVFDTFWWFAAERHRIYEQRQQGLPPPWTEDEILRSHHFCNTFRLADAGTQFVVREVIEVGSQKSVDVVFRVVLFCLFSKEETYQLLNDALAPLTWERYNRKAYENVLQEAREQGAVLYTGSHQKPAPKMDHCREAFKNHLRLLEAMMNAGLTEHLLQAEFMADAYAFIMSFPGMAEFTSQQLLLNLSYTHVLNFSDMDFVVGGPGSRSGLSKCFGDSIILPKMETDVMRWMAETQDEHFARLDLTFNGLGPQGLRMGLPDIEHTLCEVDKYSRSAHPNVRNKWGKPRTYLRPGFDPSPKPIPELRIPIAWEHPDRKVCRVRPGLLLKIDKRYVINKIIKKRGAKGEEEYLIDWWGYSLDQATWESAENLMVDAPDIVREYEKQAGDPCW